MRIELNSIKIILVFLISLDCFVVLIPPFVLSWPQLDAPARTLRRGRAGRLVAIFPAGSLCAKTMADSVECEIVLAILLNFGPDSNKDDLIELQRIRTKAYSVLAIHLSMKCNDSEKRNVKAFIAVNIYIKV